MAAFTDRAEYEKYREEMLEKLRRSQEEPPDGHADTSKKTGESPRARIFRRGAILAIVCISFIGFGLAAIFLFHSSINPSAHTAAPLRTFLMGEKNPGQPIPDEMSVGETDAGREGEGRLQTESWRLGFAKGRKIAGVFLTNKQQRKRDKCSEGMPQTGIESEDYLKGCLEGYDSVVRGERRVL